MSGAAETLDPTTKLFNERAPKGTYTRCPHCAKRIPNKNTMNELAAVREGLCGDCRKVNDTPEHYRCTRCRAKRARRAAEKRQPR